MLGVLASGGNPVIPVRLATGVATILLLHLSFLALALLYSLQCYFQPQPPRYLRFLAWLPLFLVLGGELLLPVVEWQWLIPP